MLARRRRILAVMFLLSGVPALNAQTVQQVPAPALAGPRVELTATAVRQVNSSSTTDVTQQRTRTASRSPAVALMIVGGAAVVLGAVIGGAAGTLFMVGGAVAVLIGLYQYLQ